MDDNQEKKFHKKNNNPNQNQNNGPRQHYNKQNNSNNNNNKGPRNNRSNSKPRYNVDKKFSEMSMGGPGPQAQAASSDILKLLECPVCMDPMTENILTCETGHSICSGCAVKLTPPLCPICRSKITLQRNYSLEQVAKSLALPCSNAQFGCKFVSLPNVMQKHFNVCDFRQVLCPLGKAMNKCFWQGRNADLSDHMRNSHHDNMKFTFGKEMQLIEFSTEKRFADVQFIPLNRDAFLLHLNVNVDQKIAYFALQYIGQSYRAKKWKYTMHLYQKSDTSKKIEVSELCSSDSDDVNDVYMQGNCVAVPLHVLRHYIQKEQNKLCFKLFANYQKE